MSKNLTRKGLAFGALVALGSSVIAGAPALAADSVTLEPKAGTSYNTILGEAYTLDSIFTDAAQQGSEYLKFLVTDADKKLDLTNSFNDRNVDGVKDSGEELDDASGTNLTANDGIYVESSNNSVGPAKNRLVLKGTGTATFSVTVQSWLDFDGDNTIDTGESSSTVRTVKFVKPSEVVAAASITAPVVGDTALASTLEFTDINNEQLAQANVGVAFTKGNGDALGSTSTHWLKSNVAWSATDKFAYTSGTGFTAALAAGDIIKLQPVYKSAGTPAATDTIGSAVYATVVKRSIQTVTADIVRSATAKTSASNVGTDNASQEVNRNKEFKFKITAKDNSATPKAVANAAVKISIFSSNFSSISSNPTAANSVTLGSGADDKKIIVNGTTYTDAAKLPGASSTYAKIAATTDADGVVTVTVQTANFAVGDHVSAKFEVENYVRYVSARAVDPTYTSYITNASTGLSTTDGAAAAVNVVVVDQFGGAPADEYDARAVWVSSSQTTPATTASSTSSAVVSGKATLSILDNGTGTGTNVYQIVVSKRASGGGYASSLSDADSNFEIRVKTAAELVAGKITSTGTLDADTSIYNNDGPTALNLVAAGTYDSRLVLGDAPTVTNSIALSGVVSTTNLTPIEGASLTIAGAGLQFKKNGSTIYGKDSLTVYTNASGQWAIDVASNKAGKQAITLTSGGVTQKVTVTFTAAAADTGASLAITAPASILPGRTLTLAAKLTDKFGNGVDTDANNSVSRTVSVTWDGPGLVSGTLPTAFDADGNLSVKVLLGATETGSGTFTVKYSQNNDTDFSDTDDITKSATVTVGAAAAPAVVAGVSAGKGKFNVAVTNAAGKSVVVKVAGKFVTSFTGTASKKTVAVKASKGSKKVTVYVGGKLVATKTVSVK